MFNSSSIKSEMNAHKQKNANSQLAFFIEFLLSQLSDYLTT
ncbi:hypothetical protein VCRA2120O333_50010 [Vibrio crassostreae]|nr:hypothetical protein VCRA2113O326_50010 [Vibrio crassostreae]CAK2157747.1 hypothetical protein VCRA2113O322_50235 [Vibrio crassostreae]CAK2174101.1 hypothetical protein VCRA2111O320_50010 [Vibrio crassostreae]CAK2205436.1 hypothetical protein VCRA2113O324_60223 [Vibrio crassostreae]CAK2519348.1 hypothetical protein VCRA2114E327_60232 [Vibrio crassostreae]